MVGTIYFWNVQAGSEFCKKAISIVFLFFGRKYGRTIRKDILKTWVYIQRKLYSLTIRFHECRKFREPNWLKGVKLEKWSLLYLIYYGFFLYNGTLCDEIEIQSLKQQSLFCVAMKTNRMKFTWNYVLLVDHRYRR